jgi:Flp pilus assembly protein TadB
MPLSDHEQRILDEIERRLAEEDPRLVESVSRTSLTIHLLRRIRWSLLAFFAGFFMLMLLFVSIWIAVAGFAVMVTSAMLVYHYLKQMGKDQLRTLERGGRLSLTAALARWTERFRRPPPGGRDS